jgi:hypothetical protein
MILTLQLVSNLLEIVHFAIESNDIASTERLHRLMPGLGEVEDGQTSMPEGD